MERIWKWRNSRKQACEQKKDLGFNKSSLSDRLFSGFSYHYIIFLVAILFVGLYNDIFWHKIYNYAILQDKGGYLLIGIIFLSLVLIFSLAMEILCVFWSFKSIAGILFLLAALSKYYMETLAITINENVIVSLFGANLFEVREFLNMGLFWSLLKYAAFPIFLLSLIRLKRARTFSIAIYSKTSLIFLYLILIAVVYVWEGQNIVFAFKSEKSIAYTLNPIAPIRSTVRYISGIVKPTPSFVHVGLDAKRESGYPKVFVLVIGESARSLNFSLNGYERATNVYTRELKRLISFTNFYSCGVITAISIPCMLTNYTHNTYTDRKLSFYIDNILDITQRVGYDVYWISNNGGACMGGVCNRIKNVSYYNDGRLDGAMLPEIEEIIKNAKQDSFIVINLHGSHGARYDERYPKEFEKFLPVCKNDELQKCSHQELVNAYDNSIIYTDYLIFQIIKALRENQKFDTALWYLSDHGESLGEYGQYMHGGLPYALSPDVQVHIPSMIWLGKGFDNNYDTLEYSKDKTFNQDYLFHTLLKFLGIKTQAYEGELDILLQ